MDLNDRIIRDLRGRLREEKPDEEMLSYINRRDKMSLLREYDRQGHIDKNGNFIPYNQLSNDHLKNIINFHLKRVEAASSILEAETKKLGNSFARAANNLPDLSDAKEEAENYGRNFQKILQPYIFEMAVRVSLEEDFRDAVKRIRTVLNREEVLEPIQNLLLPSAIEEVEVDEW